jgi:hypothetical protein
MYHMMQRRRNFGVILDAEEEDEDEDLHVFLDKYDLQKRCMRFCAKLSFCVLNFSMSIVHREILLLMSHRASFSNPCLP